MLNYVFFRNLIKYRTLYIETKYFSDYKDFVMDNVLSKEIKPNSNIAIYGFGPYGESYFLDLFSKYKITALYDRTYCLNKRIINSPEKINSEKFDYIIVTVMNEKARNGVLDFLNKKNISEEKIICVNYV